MFYEPFNKRQRRSETVWRVIHAVSLVVISAAVVLVGMVIYMHIWE